MGRSFFREAKLVSCFHHGCESKDTVSGVRRGGIWGRSLAVGQGLTPSACPSSTCVLPCASLRTIVGGAAAQDRSRESVGTRALAGGGGRDGRAGREPCITWHGAVLILQTTSSVSCVAGSCAKCGAQLSRADSTTQQRRAGRAGRRVQQRRPRLCAANGRRTRKKTKTRERAAHR